MSDILMPNGLPQNIKYEEYPIHNELSIIRESNKKNVIGYVNKDPLDHGWFWFIMNDISKTFNDKDDAIADLVHSFLTARYNAMAKKMGTLDNDKYTKF